MSACRSLERRQHQTPWWSSQRKAISSRLKAGRLFRRDLLRAEKSPSTTGGERWGSLHPRGTEAKSWQGWGWQVGKKAGAAADGEAS